MNEQHFLKAEKIKSAWLENVLDELDEPGEWVLKSKEGKVYLRPRFPWSRGKTPVLRPGLIEFIRVEGKVDFEGPTDVPVRNLCFPRTHVFAWRPLLDRPGRRGVTTRLGFSGQGQCPGSPSRYRKLRHRPVSLCSQRKQRDPSRFARTE